MVSLDRFIKRFNTQPPEGGCSVIVYSLNFGCGFQHTAARRRLLNGTDASRFLEILFQHTAARRRLRSYEQGNNLCERVSTHSRPKAAASDSVMFATCCCWVSTHSRPKAAASVLLNATVSFSAFQHTAARRRLRELSQDFQAQENVSTHSRPKAAASNYIHFPAWLGVSTHSRPKAAAERWYGSRYSSFSFNTQPPEGGCIINRTCGVPYGRVSTHSRPKAAANQSLQG